MEFLIVVAVLVGLVAGYFFLGMLLKLLLQWWLALVCAVPLILLAVSFSWQGAIAAVVGVLFLIGACQAWQESAAYLRFEAKINKAFYFDDI